MKKFLNKLPTILLYFLPAILFFSYHPVISLGSNNYMNFDLSLPEIWLVLFLFSLLPKAKSIIKFYGAKKLLISSIIPVYFSLSAIWSDNHIRAILTSGILWLLLFTVLGIIMLIKEKKNLRMELLKILLISAYFISAICILQCILDLFGVGREYTLLCKGCTYTAFGFPHPNGFAIEPQFMGNLLLVPTLLSFYLIYKHAYKSQKQKIILSLLTVFLTTTLFLTLSRGAIYAFVIGLATLFIVCSIKHYSLIKAKLKQAVFSVVIVLVALSLSLVSEGIFAQVSPTNDTFYSGVTKAIHQLSLGKLDFRPAEIIELTENTTSSEAAAEAKDADSETSTFSGYVPESTNIRLGFNSLAIDTWRSNPRYLLIGTGLGSAGIAMNKTYPESTGAKEIVQNEYLSLLLEVGVIGVTIIILIAIYAVRKTPKNPLLIATVVSFAFSLLFFSGLPNALHIYILPVLFITGAKDNLFIKDKVKCHCHQRH